MPITIARTPIKHPTKIPVGTCGGRGGDVMGLFVARGDGGDNAKGGSDPVGVVGVVLGSDGEAGGVGGEIVCGEGLADGGFGGNEGVGIGGGGEVLCGGFKGWEGSGGDGGGGGDGEGGEVRGVCESFVGGGEEAGGGDNDNGGVCGLAIVCKTGGDREEENMGCDLICLYVKGYYGCEHVSFDRFKTMNSSYFKFRDIYYCYHGWIIFRIGFLSTTAMILKWISIILEFEYPKSVLVSHYY